MCALELSAHMTVRPGQLDGFKKQAAECIRLTRKRHRDALQLGATYWHFRHESRVTSTPIWVQNLMLPPLWALAKVFGVRPCYHHWDSRI
jgi:hypothetical protein